MKKNIRSLKIIYMTLHYKQDTLLWHDIQKILNERTTNIVYGIIDTSSAIK
jgi:hypothetical protein